MLYQFVFIPRNQLQWFSTRVATSKVGGHISVASQQYPCLLVRHTPHYSLERIYCSRIMWQGHPNSWTNMYHIYSSLLFCCFYRNTVKHHNYWEWKHSNVKYEDDLNLNNIQQLWFMTVYFAICYLVISVGNPRIGNQNRLIKTILIWFINSNRLLSLLKKRIKILNSIVPLLHVIV